MDRTRAQRCPSCCGSLIAIIWLFYEGIGIWGINTTVVWGFAIANYVWWIGIGNAGTLISSMLLSDAAELARLDQPLRRDDDAVRGRDRRLVPDPPSRPADLFLLAGALPEHDGAVAAMAQRAGLGFLGDPQLPPLLDPVLLCRPAARPRHDARPGQHARRAVLYGAFALGWRGSARHWRALPDAAHHDGGARRAAGRARCTPSSGSISPPA